MTEEALTAIEARLMESARTAENAPGDQLAADPDDVRALMAEVRRLRQDVHDLNVAVEYWKACRL